MKARGFTAIGCLAVTVVALPLLLVLMAFAVWKATPAYASSDCGLPVGGKGPMLAATAAYAAGFRGNDLVISVAIAGAESGYDPTATNLGGHVVGLWQIYFDMHRDLVIDGAPLDINRLKDPAYNGQAAFLVQRADGWGPWDTWWADPKNRIGPGQGAYLNHMQEAQAAVSQLLAGGAPGASPSPAATPPTASPAPSGSASPAPGSCGGHVNVTAGIPMTCPALAVSRGYGYGGSGILAGFHPGIDLVCPQGTPVLATVVGVFHRHFSGCNDFASACGYGTYATVDPPVPAGQSPIEFIYGHLGQGRPYGVPAPGAFALPDGAQVQPGDIIGFEGTTGMSTGPHLHFQVNVGGSSTNPCPYFPKDYPTPQWNAAGCPYALG